MYASRFSSIIPTLDFHRRGIVSRASPRSTVPTLDFHRRGIVSRASPRRGGISGVTSAHLNVHRPSGGDDAMDRVQISDPDPFSAKASDYMSTPAAFVTPELELGDPIVKKLLRSYSGVPVLDAIEIVAKSAGNVVIEDGLMYAREKISEGRNMADPLAELNIFPGMVVQMVGVGEQTGALDQMLTKIADFYEDETDVAVASLTSMLEPIMMVFIGGIVGVVLVSMYLPIFSLAGNIKAD